MGFYKMKNIISENFHILALDIETSGSSYKDNGILSIGASLQDQEFIEKESFQVNILLPEGRTYEKNCKEKFWDKFPEAQKFVKNNAIEPKEAMQSFSKFLFNIENRYPNTVIVSDNPSFDIAWVDYYLDIYADRKPLRYSENEVYNMVWDSASIQKAWLCFKTPDSSFYSPPRDHREKLKLQTQYVHDHNPLNDARIIANFYIQTIKQMEQFRDIVPKPTVPKTIKLENYNPKWQDFFTNEKHMIQNSFTKSESKNNLEDIIHVGSTSIEGLVAKPIIDIILVVKNSDQINKVLSGAGYRYKGEYNIPMRKMYGKNDDYEVYLHAYETGHPEIKLNLLFKDYLKNNPSIRDEYSNLKKSIIEKNNSHTKLSSTGITTYNLDKNDFIQKVLNKAGFNELCIRLCTQSMEWENYNLIKENYFLKINKKINITDNDPNHKHVALYKGTNVIGAAEVKLSPPNAFLEFLGLNNRVQTEIQEIKCYFLKNLENWVKKIGVLFLTTSIPKEEVLFYESNEFKFIKDNNNLVHMFKYIEDQNKVQITGEQTNLIDD